MRRMFFAAALLAASLLQAADLEKITIVYPTRSAAVTAFKTRTVVWA